MWDHARNSRQSSTRDNKRRQMGRKMRKAALDHEYYSYSRKIFQMCRDRRTTVSDKREDGQMGWEKHGGRKEGRKGRIKERPYAVTLGGVARNFRFLWMRIASRRLLGPVLLCHRDPKTSVIRLAVQISHWSRFSPVKNRRWFLCSHPRKI